MEAGLIQVECLTAGSLMARRSVALGRSLPEASLSMDIYIDPL